MPFLHTQKFREILRSHPILPQFLHFRKFSEGGFILRFPSEISQKARKFYKTELMDLIEREYTRKGYQISYITDEAEIRTVNGKTEYILHGIFVKFE